MLYNPMQTDEEIRQVLELQKLNLPGNLTPEQIASQGFVTVVHSFDTLKKMNDREQSIIAKDNNQVVGYLLAMTPESKSDIPILIPMFKEFDEVIYKEKKISNYKYIVVGQVCIALGYRGKGFLDECYQAYREHFKSKYDFAITEIHDTNQRSINAHKRIGFQTVHIYNDVDGNKWHVVLWDWGV
jgi:hypothetical protein